MKKAVFFDIDGTLIDCTKGINAISPRVKKYIKILQNEGNYVFIATGRPYAFIYKELLDFGFDGLVLTNGAQVIIENKSIYKREINKNFVKKLIYDFEKFDVQYILQGETYSYIKEKYRELYSYYDSFYIPRKYIKSEYNIDDVSTYKIEMLCKNKEGTDYCLSLENEEYDYIHNSSSNVFEFYSKRDTKASGIIKVLEHLNIPISNSYAFGDGKNDIEMLKSVGCGIAMGNAGDEVKNSAREVTDRIENDGIAAGIEKFILGRSI